MPAAKPPQAPFRPNLYLVARFLDALARPPQAYSKTQLQLAVGVNYDIFRRYVAFLAAKGYLVVTSDASGAETLRTTPEGAALRRELAAWIVRFLGEGGLAGR